MQSKPSKGAAIGIAAAVLLLAGVGLAWKLGSRGDASAVAATTPSGNYHVVVRVEPSSAKLELDGTLVGTGAFERDLARDGSKHTLTVSADGFIPQTLIFRDEAPPATVALVAMPNQPHELTAPAGPAPKPLSAPRKGAAAARVEPTPARAPTPAGRRTDNIDPWEK